MNFRDPTLQSGYELAANRMASGVLARCAPRFGPSVSDSKTTDSRTSATDNALVVRDSSAAATGAASQSSVATGGGRSTVIRGRNNRNVQGSNNVVTDGPVVTGSKGPVTITTADPEIVKTALLTVTDLAKSGGQALLDNQAQTNSALASLAESKQTGGASGVNKNLVIVAVVGLAALAWAVTKKS